MIFFLYLLLFEFLYILFFYHPNFIYVFVLLINPFGYKFSLLLEPTLDARVGETLSRNIIQVLNSKLYFDRQPLSTLAPIFLSRRPRLL